MYNNLYTCIIYTCICIIIHCCSLDYEILIVLGPGSMARGVCKT